MTRADIEDDLERAATLCLLRRHHQAIALLENVVAANPDDGVVCCHLSVAYLGINDAHNALGSAARAASLLPDAEWPHRLLSCALMRLGRHDAALSAARRAVAIAPGNWLAQVQLANALLQNDNVREAKGVARQVAAMAPDATSTHRLLAAVAHRQRHYARAESHMRRALAIDPTRAELLSDFAFFELRRLGHLNPARLAQSSAHIAEAIRSDLSDPSLVARLDLLLAVFLRTVAVIVLFGAVDALRLLSDDPSPRARLLPAILLLVPGAYAIRTLTHMPSAVRHRLLMLVRGERAVQVAFAGETVAVTAVLLAGAVPFTARPPVSLVAVVGALVTLLAIGQHRRAVGARMGRRGARVVSSVILYFIALAFWLTALAVIMFATRREAGVIVGIFFAAAGVGTVTYARRRH